MEGKMGVLDDLLVAAGIVTSLGTGGDLTADTKGGRVTSLGTGGDLTADVKG
jgi:hypothetical protein